ncbi:MAG: hypothetical protein ROO76_19425, partial [Terriglobia bacterium]|nr:hypothetical protein [Terriglobia bacterium]
AIYADISSFPKELVLWSHGNPWVNIPVLCPDNQFRAGNLRRRSPQARLSQITAEKVPPKF